MTPPAATAAGRGRKAAAKRAPAKRAGSGAAKRAPAKRAAVKGGLAKPPRSSSRTAGRAGTRTVRRSAAPRISRRVSGPAGGRAAAGLAVALPRPQVAPLGPRLVAFASTLPDRSLVGRMVRGRVWIGVLGFLLIGLVAMQVSLLKLNAGIGSAVERSSALERANGELRAQVSQLESGERIQEGASALGMVMPPAGQISYLRPGQDVSRAAAALRNGSFNDPAKAIPLPGAGDPPDPLATALVQGEEGTADAPASEETASTDDTASGETVSDDTASGETVSDETASDETGSDEAHSHDTAGEVAAVGGTSAGE